MIEEFSPADLVRRDTERLKRYKDLLDFYHDSHWEGRERRNEKRLTFNYARAFIDKVTSYLMSGNSLVVEPQEDMGLSPSPIRLRSGQALHLSLSTSLKYKPIEGEGTTMVAYKGLLAT